MIRYSEEIIEEIRNANDIVDVISQYVVLKRSGRNFFGLCPFHKEKSPSFSVSPDKQIFHCFGCGVGGNVIHFLGKIEGMNFVETLQALADRAGIVLPKLENAEEDKVIALKEKIYQINEQSALFYHENLYKPEAKMAQEYIKKRKLDNRTLKSFQIGFSGKNNELYTHLKQLGFKDDEIVASNLVSKTREGGFIDRFRGRLMFPIQDVRNKTIAFGGRVLDDSKPKYINSPEGLVYSKGRHLYGLNIAKKEQLSNIIIVEGYMDCISLHQRGITNAVASLGTALTEAQGRLLRRYGEKIIISYDADAAGQSATMRGLDILNNLGCDLRILQMEGAKDPDEYVIKYGSGRFNLLVENAISLVEFKIKMLRQNSSIEATNDKIKFLNEVAKILSVLDNKMEQEIYIDKIAQEYSISKEAIYAQINKIQYQNSQGSKVLESGQVKRAMPTLKMKEEGITEAIQKREKIVIWLLINNPETTYRNIRDRISPLDLKVEKNRKIVEKLYEEYEKGNININQILNEFEEEVVNYITGIMAENLEITDVTKAIKDVLVAFEREKLVQERNKILKDLSTAQRRNKGNARKKA